jgi:hypothetical protein
VGAAVVASLIIVAVLGINGFFKGAGASSTAAATAAGAEPNADAGTTDAAEKANNAKSGQEELRPLL